MTIKSSSSDGQSGSRSIRWLVLFAVKEEAAGFTSQRPTQATLLTGMGSHNASSSIQVALERWRPNGVITAGFAGGLNPALHRGAVIYDLDDALGIESSLRELGAVPAVFHNAARIAVTAADKAALRQQTGADAVEMESAIIRGACRNAGIHSGTIRVISDAADDDLPLDFNALLTSAQRIDWWKFARTIAFRPSVIGRLIEFQRQTREAARQLGRVLNEVVKQPPPVKRRHGVP